MSDEAEFVRVQVSDVIRAAQRLPTDYSCTFEASEAYRMAFEAIEEAHVVLKRISLRIEIAKAKAGLLERERQLAEMEEL